MTATIVFGLSGPSCSGKTTVALNLLKLFPQTIVIHQDDFYKPDNQIPVNEALRIQDWDCPTSFDMQAMVKSIRSLRKQFQSTIAMNNATDIKDIQSHFASQWANPPEDVEKVVDTVVLESLRKMILQFLQIDSLELVPFYIILVDGILLFHDSEQNAIHPCAEFDAGIFIYAQYGTLKERREARAGYATKEGVWTDPPGYFDSIVWPNFVKYHKQFIQAHPQILEKSPNANNNGTNNYNAKDPQSTCPISVCSSETPVANTLRISVQMILDSWQTRHS